MSHRFICAAVAALICGNAAAVDHYSKSVSLLEAAMSDCYFFKLTDVAQSDPVTPGSPWFAILRTQANAQEMYTMLFTARVTGTPLQRVITNGSTVCGHAQVSTIDF